jgi:multidrug efflux pump subunit AcrA (membrane-fusion protein)
VTLDVQGTGGRNGKTREWAGVVDSVVPRSNWQTGSRSFPVIVLVRNEIDESMSPPVPALREGMMAEAAFRGEPIDGILVPKDSMVRTSRGTFIYVVNPSEEGKPLSVRQVLVTPGVSEDAWIQVIGDGLAADQRVVTEGAERLRAFQTVQIMKDEGIGSSK